MLTHSVLIGIINMLDFSFTKEHEYKIHQVAVSCLFSCAFDADWSVPPKLRTKEMVLASSRNPDNVKTTLAEDDISHPFKE